MLSSKSFLKPSPTPVTITTEATPNVIPMSVKKDLRGFEKIALTANFKFSMTISLFFHQVFQSFYQFFEQFCDHV